MTLLGFHEQFASDLGGEFSSAEGPAVDVVVTSMSGVEVIGKGVYEYMGSQDQISGDGSQVIHAGRVHLPKATFASIEVGDRVAAGGITWRVDGLVADNPACHVALLGWLDAREKGVGRRLGGLG